jgi:hypothetical protein
MGDIKDEIEDLDNLSDIPSIKSYRAPEDENLVDDMFE